DYLSDENHCQTVEFYIEYGEAQVRRVGTHQFLPVEKSNCLYRGDLWENVGESRSSGHFSEDAWILLGHNAHLRFVEVSDSGRFVFDQRAGEIHWKSGEDDTAGKTIHTPYGIIRFDTAEVLVSVSNNALRVIV